MITPSFSPTRLCILTAFIISFLVSHAAIANDALRTVIQQGHTDDIKFITYSQDGRLFFSTANDRSIKIWHQDGKLLRTLSLPKKHIFWMQSYLNGQRLAIGMKHLVLIYDTNTGLVLKSLKGKAHSYKQAAIHQTGKIIITTNNNNDVTIRNPDWSARKTLKKVLTGPINQIILNPTQETFLVTGSSNNSRSSHLISAKLYDWDGKLLNNIEQQKPSLSAKKSPFIRAVKDAVFSHDGQMIALLSDRRNAIHIYTATGKNVMSSTNLSIEAYLLKNCTLQQTINSFGSLKHVILS
ncbi:MAG: hypothetical protein HN790_00600 [Methylococcales bacterium]|jgi:WD40 repeat protein|nr:hypothetical protein [Methylococcales bacterium]